MPFSLSMTVFCTTWLQLPPSMSRGSSLSAMQLQKARPAVEALMSTPSSEICAFWSRDAGGTVGYRPSRMLRYFTVTRDELRILITSPLLPDLSVSGGALRAIVDVSVPGGGPYAPEHPPKLVSDGGSPVMSRLK